MIDKVYYPENPSDGVALAKIHFAMKEGGVEPRNGKRVSSKSHLIQKLLEMAYEMMRKNS